MTEREQTQRGFTLVELMVSLVLFSFAVAGVLAVAVSITNGYREQRQIVAAEGAVRVPLDFIADALRQTSPGVKVPANIRDGVTCADGAVDVTNSTTGPDELEVIYASGAVVTSTRTVLTTTSVTVNEVDEFAVDDFVLVTNLDTGHLFKIASITGSTLNFYSFCAGVGLPSSGYDVGSLVIRAHHARFFIDALDGKPTLFMDPDGDRISTPNDKEPLAEGVEDMQVAVGVDANNDNTIDDDGTAADEWFYNNAADAAHTGTIRAVRVTLVARASMPLLGGGSPLFQRPAAEDRGASTANDAYRRRVLRTTVELRNIGGSP